MPAVRQRRNANREPEHVAEAPVRQTQHVKGRLTVRGRTRQNKSTMTDSPLDFPIDQIPEGSSYEWKRFSVFGKEDPFYLSKMRDQGWEPVDPKMHANLLPPGYKEPHIIKDGMILMERPIELTQQARKEMRQDAITQVRDAENRLGRGGDEEMERLKPSLQKEMMIPIAIEE
jgi:hypothetical protein